MAQYVPLPDGSTVTVREGETPEQAYARAQQMYPEAFKAAAPAPAKPTVMGQAGEFFKGLAPGAIGAVESAAIGASALLPEEYEKKARSGIARLAGAAKAPFAATPGYEETIGRKFGEAAGSIAPFLLTRSKPTAAGLGAGMGAGEARTRAEQEGATPDQISKATALGSVVGLSEMFAPSRILGRVDEPIKAGIAAQLKRIALAGGEEAAQEAASQAAQNLIAKGIYKPEQAIIEQVGESAAYGGAVGALAQGLFDMALGRRAKKALTQDEISKARADADAAAAAEAARKAEPGYAKQFVEDYDARKAEFVTARSELKKPGNDATPDIWAAYNEQKKALEEMRNGLAKDAKEYNTLRQVVQADQAKATEEERKAAEEARKAKLTPFEYAFGEVPEPKAPEAKEEKQWWEVEPAGPGAPPALSKAAQRVELARDQLYEPTVAQYAEYIMRDPALAQELVQLQQRIPGLKAKESDALLSGLKLQLKNRLQKAAAEYQPGTPAAEAEEAAALEESRRQDEAVRLEAEREKKIAPEVMALRRMSERPAGLTNIAAPFGQPTPEAPAGSAAMAMMDQRLRLEADLTAAREELARATKDDQFEPTPQTKQAVLRAADRYSRAQADYDTALAKMRQQELIPTGEEEKPAAAPVVRKAPSEGFRLFPRQGAPERPSDYQNLSTRLASALARDDIDQDTYNFLRRAEKVLPTVDQRIETARAERGERGVIRDVSSTEGFLTLLDQQLDLIERNQEGVYPSRRYVQEPFRARGSAAEGAPGSEASGRDIGKFRTMESGSFTKAESERRARRVPAMPGEAERFNMPGAPAAMRAEATTGTTLRTPAAPLSLAGELEPLLRLQEQLAGPDLTETTQGELFPSRATGVVRSSFEKLVKFMQSKAVQALRTALPKTAADVAKQEKALPALKARVEELQKRLTTMEEAARDYKTAQQVLKSNKDLVNTERDIQSVQKAITANVTSRINLEKQIQDLGAEIRRLTEARQELVTPVMSVTKLKGASGKIGMGRGEIRPYQPRDVETDPVLGAQLVNLEQRTTDLQARMQELLNERNTIDGALAQLDNYVKVIQARNKVTELQEKSPFGYELDAAKEALFNAQRAAGIVQQEISKGKTEIAATAGQERRRQEAIARAKKLDESVARAKEEQKRLEAMYSQEVTGEQVQADPEAQARRMAAEMGAPDYTPTERVELMKDPNKVLGGLNSEVTKLQKQIDAAKKAAIAARKAELAPYRASLDALEAAYKVAQDSGTRAALLKKIDVATRMLQNAVDRQELRPFTFKGYAKMQRDLAIALNKAEDLETKLGVGRVVDKNAPERAAPIFKPSKQEQAAAAQERQRIAAAEAEERASAPATSGEALTKSEAKKAAAAKPTVYTGRGVGTETANPMAKGKGTQAPRYTEPGKKTVAPALSVSDAIEARDARLVKIFNVRPDYTSPYHGKTYAEVAKMAAENASSPLYKKLFSIIGDSIENRPVKDMHGRVFVTDKAGFNKEMGYDRVTGLYDATMDLVIVPSNSLSSDAEEVLLHELAHVATLDGLSNPRLGEKITDLRTQVNDWLNTAEGRAYFEANKEQIMRGTVPGYAAYGLTDNAEFVAEVFSNKSFQEMLKQIPSAKQPKPGGQPVSVWNRLVDAFSEFFGLRSGAERSLFEDALEVADRAMRLTEEKIELKKFAAQAKTGKVKAVPISVRAPRYASPEMETAGAALDPFIAKNKSGWEKLKANMTGLAFETQVVDRFAGFERLKKYMPEHQGTQMMYYLRMYDQRMNMVSQAVATGAPNLVEKKRPDGKTERILEAKEGPSIKSVVEILKDANPMVGNAEAVNRLFTGYLAAIRAKNKGFESLNFGKDVTPEMLADALRVVENNRQLKAIFDKARGEYNAYNRNLIEFVVESGALPKAVGERLLSENDYIPFYREQNGVAELLIGKETPIRIGSIKEQPYLHELVGGDQPILDFMTSSVQNTNMLLDMGMRNLATKNAVFELIDLNAAKIVRGKPEGRDVVKFKVDGEDKYAVLSTEKVKIGNKEFDTGVPADILVTGMEGIPTQMPFLLRAMAMPSQLLRKGVTLTPLYMARQLFRDSLAAPILAGADFVPIMGALKQIGAPTKQTLERRGIVGGQQFTGTSEDLTKILRDVAEGKPGWMSVLGRAEAAAMEADALTRRAQYNSYIEQGLSEMEATLLALESMNFNKRGASPSVHWANAMIPFFNAQIQGLNVLYKAMSGKMPFNDKLRIREKLLQRGGMMAVASMLYAIAMQDDETYENAEPDQKYGNWFVSVPGTNEKLRVPVPFEIGYIFKAIPEALVNTMLNKHGGEEAVKAFRQILIQTIPGGTSMPQIGGVPVPVPIPQALKPAIEAGLGKSFYTGRDILSSREKQLLPEEQFRANTTEMAKLLGKTFGFSPIIFENLVRGYTGTVGLAFMQALSLGVPPGESPEAAVKRLSEYPVVGGAFQPNDAGGIVNSVYERMQDAQEVARTYEKMLTEGRTAEANALLQRRGEQILQAELGKEFKSNMDQLVAAERAIQASRMSAEEKRKQLDQIKQLKIAVAKQVRDVADKFVELNFSL